MARVNHPIAALLLALAASPALAAAIDCASLDSPAAVGQALRNQVLAAPGAAGSGGNLYRLPSEVERTQAQAALLDLLQGREVTSQNGFAGLGYQLCRLPSMEDGSVWWLGLHAEGNAAASAVGWPAFLLRQPEAAAPLPRYALSLPHAVTEFRVAEVGFALFAERPDAVRLLLLAPLHRCNRSELAPERYQGVTSQCDGSYRISDMAHVDDSLFQAFHEALSEAFPLDVVLSLHGMSASGASVSAGLAGDPVDYPSHPMGRLHGRLASGLQALRSSVADITACSPHSGPFGGQTAQILCGSRTAQGIRLRDNGRQRHFIHIEMDRAAREQADQVSALGAALESSMLTVFGTGFE